MPRPIQESPPPLRISIDDADFADCTARYVCDYFISLQVRGGRPQASQWTILAAFLAYTPPEADDTAGTVKILTFGLGNKCVSIPVQREQQVVDMHAEILARRELEGLLLEGFKAIGLAEGLDIALSASETFSMDILQSLVLRRSDLYLYTSHMPCGAASNIAQLDRLDKEDEVMKRLLKNGTFSVPTGSSTFRSLRQIAVPPLVKKPSRGDAFPTTCYSCSDKLSRYQMLGYQGGRLSALFDKMGWAPIRINGLIVGEDFFDGQGLRMVFGGTVQTRTDPREDYTYARMIDGLEQVFAQEDGPAVSLFRDTLRDVVRDFRIYGTTWRFAHSRSSVTALACGQEGLAQGPALVFDTLSMSEQAKLRTLPLPIVRETLFPRPPVSSFALSCSWRAGQSVEVFGPAGVPSGTKRSKTTGDFERTSRICRQSLRAAYKEACGKEEEEGRKGSSHWQLVSSWMESRGPWKDWHKVRHQKADLTVTRDGYSCKDPLL